MKIKLNGKYYEIGEEVLLQDFLRERKLDPQRCVAEVNGEALSKDKFLVYILKDGDVVEVMQLVAGG